MFEFLSQLADAWFECERQEWPQATREQAVADLAADPAGPGETLILEVAAGGRIYAEFVNVGSLAHRNYLARRFASRW